MISSKVVLRILNVCLTVLCIVLVFFGLMKLGTVAYDTGYRVITEKPVERAPGRDIEVEIKKGMSVKTMGKIFEKKGLIEDGKLFVLQVKLSAYVNKIKPGVYTLNTSQTVREMLQVMSEETESEDQKK